MELTGLEPRRSDLARGIVIARSAQPLDGAGQRALWDLLAAAGVIELEAESTELDDPQPERRWHAAPWLPPTPAELDGQRAAFERAGTEYGLEALWCYKVETGIDGVAWLDLASAEPIEETSEASDPEAEVVDAIFDAPAEVLYSAPDAPTVLPGGADDDDDDDDDGDEDEATEDELEHDGIVESHWRNGAPPFEHAVPFPIERYPEVIDDYDWERFGIAVKLAGTALPGEESVINAFFALWLSVYQDERADEFEAFQRADVVHDRKHRAALMWVERFAVPATANDQVHFLLWIVARITTCCRSHGRGSTRSTTPSRLAPPASPGRIRSSCRATRSPSGFAVTARRGRSHGRSPRARGADASWPAC
ncbi:MAG: hypothetical protein WKG01_16550 [Kofleriaceae bacterium]